jgi:hypothetical protein
MYCETEILRILRGMLLSSSGACLNTLGIYVKSANHILRGEIEGSVCT